MKSTLTSIKAFVVVVFILFSIQEVSTRYDKRQRELHPENYAGVTVQPQLDAVAAPVPINTYVEPVPAAPVTNAVSISGPTLLPASVTVPVEEVISQAPVIEAVPQMTVGDVAPEMSRNLILVSNTVRAGVLAIVVLMLCAVTAYLVITTSQVVQPITLKLQHDLHLARYRLNEARAYRDAVAAQRHRVVYRSPQRSDTTQTKEHTS